MHPKTSNVGKVGIWGGGISYIALLKISYIDLLKIEKAGISANVRSFTLKDSKVRAAKYDGKTCQRNLAASFSGIIH